MAIPTWYWPPSGAAARGIALVPTSTGLAVADWSTPTVWPFSGTTFSAGVTLASGTPGLCAAVPAASGNLWALTWDGNLYSVASSGTLATTFPASGGVYVGLAADAATNKAYGVTSSGSYYIWDGATTTSGAFGSSARTVSQSASSMYSLLPVASGIGSVPFSGGASGLIAYPAAITTVSTFAVSGSTIAIGGWGTAPSLSGMAAAALDPQDGTAMLAVGSGKALLWRSTAPLSDNWTQSQVLSGLANLSALGWRPDGTQVLAPSVMSGAVQVIAYSAGVMSLAQTLTLTGACAVAVAGDSQHAVVAQSGQAQLTPLTFGSIWATGTAVTGLPGIVSVAPYGASGAVAAYSTGLAFLQLLAGTWSIVGAVALPFTPRVMTVDPFSIVYVAGSGSVAAVSGTTLLGSGAWAGAAPTAIAVQEGRAILAVPSDGSLYVYGETAPATWSVQTTRTLALGTQVGLGLSNTTLFTLGSGSTVTYGFSGTPFSLTTVTSGAVGRWNGASWSVVPLGIGHNPSAITFDASGTVYLATTENTLWTVTSGNVAVSGIITQYSPQPQTVPLGVSDLLIASGNVYATTSMPGNLGVWPA